MKKLTLATLLAVIPSALMAQLVSLENAVEKTEIAVNSDDVTAKELTAVPFDGAVKKESGDSVVVTDNGSTGLNKNDTPLVNTVSKKRNLTSTMSKISKEKGKSVFKKMSNTDDELSDDDYEFSDGEKMWMWGIGGAIAMILLAAGTAPAGALVFIAMFGFAVGAIFCSFFNMPG